MNDSMECLRALNLSKQYSGRQIVDDVSMEIGRGRIVGLLGPNGAGKTTCFYMISGLVRADRGQVLLGSRELTHMPMYKRTRHGLGYLPQEPSIFRRLSPLENLLAVIEMRADIPRRKQRAAAMALLEEFRVAHIAHQPGAQVSGGERRRVEIARAMAGNPAFILLDEPFAGIDPISIDGIKDIIAALAERGLGVLIIDHNVREILSLCDHTYVVSQGRLIDEGTTDKILQNKTIHDSYLGSRFHL